MASSAPTRGQPAALNDSWAPWGFQQRTCFMYKFNCCDVLISYVHTKPRSTATQVGRWAGFQCVRNTRGTCQIYMVKAGLTHPLFVERAVNDSIVWYHCPCPGFCPVVLLSDSGMSSSLTGSLGSNFGRLAVFPLFGHRLFFAPHLFTLFSGRVPRSIYIYHADKRPIET